ncbi:MAG: hypothetical protein U0T36_13160 [Saprospiraceae bacterium]
MHQNQANSFSIFIDQWTTAVTAMMSLVDTVLNGALNISIGGFCHLAGSAQETPS